MKKRINREDAKSAMEYKRTAPTLALPRSLRGEDKREFQFLRALRAFAVASLILLLALAPLGCDGNSSAPDPITLLPTTIMQIGGQKFVVEKAISPGEQERGLMYRDSMPADHGMIFPYDHMQAMHYWNKNVRFALDNLFLDGSGKIISIQHMEPYDGKGTAWVTAQYVIELNAGEPAKLGLKLGDAITIPADAILH